MALPLVFAVPAAIKLTASTVALVKAAAFGAAAGAAVGSVIRDAASKDRK